MRFILIIPALALLSACNPEKKDDPLEPEREAIDITSENTVLSFRSQAQGDYPVVTDLSLNNPVSAHPLVATIPELFKLEQADELEQYLKSSEALGFDREPFNTLYNLAWDAIEEIRHQLMLDLIYELESSATPTFTITSTIDPGHQGVNKRYTYSIQQNHVLNECDDQEVECSVALDIELSFYSAEQGFGFSTSSSGYLFSWTSFDVEIHRFKLQRASSLFELSPNGDNVISVDFGAEIYGDENGTFTSMENWSNKEDHNHFGEKGLTGIFTNSFIDENGNEKTVSVTGHIHASFPRYMYYRNSSASNYTYPDFSERDTPIEEKTRIPLEKNSMAGHLLDANIEVQFATDINE